MATGVIIGGAVLGAVGKYKERKAGKAAASEQARLDAENRRLYQLEVDESVKRTKAVNEQTEGIAAANVGASGFGVGSSMDSYLDTIKSTHASDVEWMETSGASNIAIQEREAAARQRNANAYADAGFIKGIGSSLSSMAGYKWG